MAGIDHIGSGHRRVRDREAHLNARIQRRVVHGDLASHLIECYARRLASQLCDRAARARRVADASGGTGGRDAAGRCDGPGVGQYLRDLAQQLIADAAVDRD